MSKLDPNEILPFCLRCFNVGCICDGEANHCHNCGGGGTCIPLARELVEYAKENVIKFMDWRERAVLRRFKNNLQDIEHCMYDDNKQQFFCYVCGCSQADGHTPDCWIGEALNGR